MRYVVPVVLVLVAIIHALPLLGVGGGARLASLYGIADMDASLDVLMRHRAVLFGLLAAFLAYAAFKPELHGLALLGATVSVVTFLAFALMGDGYNTAVATVVRVDAVAAVLLVLGWAVHLARDVAS